MEMLVFQDIVTIFVLAIFVLLVCNRFNLPAIVGFLLTGTLCGPHGLGLVAEAHLVEMLAEVGVIFLMFAIGVEFSLEKLSRYKAAVLGGGSIQVLLTIALVTGLSLLRGLDFNRSVFLGFLAALSSTAIVLSLLQERAEADSPYGRFTTAVLIFQDLAIVPMMLIIPMLAGVSGSLTQTVLLLAAKMAGVFALVFVCSRWVVPFVLGQVVRTRSQVLFMTTTLGLCFSIAYLTYALGLSLSLGAFLAGVIVSESEYSVNALGGILPFKDVFVSFFFVSVGMLLSLGFVAAHPVLVLVATVVILALKALVAWLSSVIMGRSGRSAIISGLQLSQVGEFSFILASVGLGAGLIPEQGYQLFLAASVLTMLCTPFLFSLAPAVADRAMQWPWLRDRAVFRRKDIAEPSGEKLRDHLIISGFGLGGRNIARAAEVAGIPYVVLDVNAETVAREREAGRNILYGDASFEEVLHHADVEAARVLAITVSDAAGARRIVDLAQRINPSLHIIVRTRFHTEMRDLYDLGADEVVPEDLESSMELFSRVLARYLVPRAEVERFAEEIRAEGYGCFLEECHEPPSPLIKLGRFSDMDLSIFTICPQAPLDGRTLEEAALRKEHGLTAVAVMRGEELHRNPDGRFRLQREDQVYVFGERREITAKAWLFTRPVCEEQP
ncbi:monovalent cation:proton antiporter family protein [Salidesulfovibrio onnuriiensis]|uniref:monovalent cation:proton antiporter family protein n=1 Tax=Salidesulfovibrio onnuriiensis TaxID=2583823 RepID=UPI0011CA8580|nr:monovalent cation:proton antiporter family protein [Salidesulfovibrio onnuriiensis]